MAVTELSLTLMGLGFVLLNTLCPFCWASFSTFILVSTRRNRLLIWIDVTPFFYEGQHSLFLTEHNVNCLDLPASKHLSLLVGKFTGNLHGAAFRLNENLRRITSPFLFWCWSLFLQGKVVLVYQCGRCQLSAWVPRVEVKDSAKSLLVLLIVWEVFTFGEVYLGFLTSSQFHFSTRKCLSPYSYESTGDASALLELQFHQNPLDLNFSCSVRLPETS